MKDFYLALFQRAYLWSAKQEFDQQPSLYSAVLYVSALQFLNLLTSVFIVESLGLWKINVSKLAAAIAPVVLFSCNWWWVSRNESIVRGDRGRYSSVPTSNRWATVYVLTTIITFVIATIAFIYTGP
jgi:hypothetical protein